MTNTTLKEKASSSVRWFSAIRILSQAISWFLTIYILRYLSPVDLGIMGFTEIFTSLMTVFAWEGINYALVQSRDMEKTAIKSIFGLCLLICSFLFASYFLSAPLIAHLFNEPKLELLIRWQSLIFVIFPFLIIPQGLLNRALLFKRRGFVDLLTNTTTGITAVTLAYHGFGVWALVIGQLVQRSLQAIGYTLAYPWLTWPSLDLKPIKGDIRSGGLYVLNSFIASVQGNVGSYLIAMMRNTNMMGIYSTVIKIASFPMSKLLPIVNEVAFSTYSRITHEDQDMIAEAFAKAIRLCSILILPMCLGLAACATSFTNAMLGPKWIEVAPALRIISVSIAFMSLYNCLWPALAGRGYSGVLVRITIISLVVNSISYAIGLYFGGFIGFCWSLVAGAFLTCSICTVITLNTLNASITRYLASTLPAWLIASTMAFCVYIIEDTLTRSGVDSLVVMAISIISGILLYVTLIVFLWRDAFLEFCELLIPETYRIRAKAFFPSPTTDTHS